MRTTRKLAGRGNQWFVGESRGVRLLNLYCNFAEKPGQNAEERKTRRLMRLSGETRLDGETVECECERRFVLLLRLWWLPDWGAGASAATEWRKEGAITNQITKGEKLRGKLMLIVGEMGYERADGINVSAGGCGALDRLDRGSLRDQQPPINRTHSACWWMGRK